jgi:hypothetical protein
MYLLVLNKHVHCTHLLGLYSEISKVLGLTGQDLGVQEDVFCEFVGNTNCKQPPLATTLATTKTISSTIATTAAPPPLKASKVVSQLTVVYFSASKVLPYC